MECNFKALFFSHLTILKTCLTQYSQVPHLFFEWIMPFVVITVVSRCTYILDQFNLFTMKKCWICVRHILLLTYRHSNPIWTATWIYLFQKMKSVSNIRLNLSTSSCISESFIDFARYSYSLRLWSTLPQSKGTIYQIISI